ncbi:MAG: DNRLRE domain-containing protein, partial [Gammaproteobacteria bacterium]
MSARRARGFVLLPVIITALLVATVALLLNLEAAAGLRRDAAMQDGQRAEQVLEAAFTHAEWALAQSGTCSSYATLAGRLAGSAGEHAYTVAVNPSAGSPVTLAASVTLASGATRTRARAGVPVYAGDLHTLVLQPGAAAGMDAVIDANRADRNYGAGTTLEVKKAARLRSLLGFPLTELPPAVRLERAVLELYAVDGTGHAAVSVAPLLGTWSEGTCVKGNCSPADGVTWNTRDGAVAWGAPGGDSVAQASVTGDAAAAPWIAFDVSAMLRERLAAGTPRADFLLADGDNAESSFASSDDADAARHPRLVLSYRCACGIDCAPPAAVARCDADFVPDLELARYPAADLGLGSTIAAEHVPAGAEYAGVSVPDGGGLLLADFNAGVIALAARASGAVLAKHAAASSNPRGVAWLGDAGDGARVAVTHYYDRMIVLHDAAGTVVRKLDTAAYTSAPSGLALIGTSASGKFDGHLAVAGARAAP